MSRRILLISGHGGADPGATSTVTGSLLLESEENVRFVQLLETELRRYDVTVSHYPYERDAYADYQSGLLGAMAQFAEYDYVLEVHFNAFRADAGDGRRKGSQCYVPLASAENGVAERILRRLSEAMQWPDRGIQPYNYAVVTTAFRSGTPAALLEVCFLDDADDMQAYLLHAEKAVRAVAEGLAEGLGLAETASGLSEADEWAREDCRWAAEQGLFLGDGDGRFRWRDSVTRQELAAVLHRMEKN